ncbi:hypothetical protein NQ315_012942 [Exocentrus adspersus]|uniref:Double jelly roll-like domain-containing protein n=2 Tax=Exocentrus adspersus TaxID=1586481 RepID=A0AAV8V8U3_9CUCU|nr:hypothetical protein NQ315_012505 [Exocentrus adspersus]KAJ8913204.1 hypothetical protein NQ315_016146 [Exocentrus adspersus]KAJ8917024.1 hypothetical protein NQ315_012942 [Exocentrus adspersus]
MDILNVNAGIYFDDAVTSAEKHTHQAYASTSLNNNDEIRIPIQQQDLYTLPNESSLYIEGKLLKTDNTPSRTAKFVNNGVMLLFDEIRYEIGGYVIDRIRNPGLTSIIKGYVSFNKNAAQFLQNSGWFLNNNEQSNIVDDNGNFNVVIDLSTIFGFCEDYRKIILNMRQELVLIRSNSDTNAIINSTENESVKVVLNKILWKMPHISVSDVERLKLVGYVARNVELEAAFRGWELHEYPLLQETQRHTWNIKTATQLEKPRFVIVGFHTDRKNKSNRNFSHFDHCNLINMKLYLNSEMFPYDNLNINFENNQIATLYDMYAKFQRSYYEKENEPIFTPSEFKKFTPLVVIDCSHQNESLKSGSVEIRLEFETNKDISPNTSCYALIIHDRLVKYNPLTSSVRIL